MSPAGPSGGDVRCESCGGFGDAEEMLEALSPSWEPMPGVFVCRDREACFRAASEEPLEAMLERRGQRGTWVCGCCGRERTGASLIAVTDDITDLFVCRDTDDCVRAFHEQRAPKLRQHPAREALNRVEAWLAGVDPADKLFGVQVINGLRGAIDGARP